MTIEPGLLDPDEIWSGSPDAKTIAWSTGLTAIPFGVVFNALVIFGALQQYERDVAMSVLLLVIFGGPGLAILFSPLVLYVRAKRTTYVLSNRRALVDTAGPFGHRRDTPLKEIRFIQLRPLRNGIGDVFFQARIDKGGDSCPQLVKAGFVVVPDAIAVERLLRQTRRHAVLGSAQELSA